MSKNAKHNDCRNFVPVDVAKGLCRVSKQMIFIDDTAVCPKFEQLSKCENCGNFVNPDSDNMGTCVGLSDKEFWASGNMLAGNCEGYKGA